MLGHLALGQLAVPVAIKLGKRTATRRRGMPGMVHGVLAMVVHVAMVHRHGPVVLDKFSAAETAVLVRIDLVEHRVRHLRPCFGCRWHLHVGVVHLHLAVVHRLGRGLRTGLDVECQQQGTGEGERGLGVHVGTPVERACGGTARVPGSRGDASSGRRVLASRSALATTETELRLMASAAIIGLSSKPNTG